MLDTICLWLGRIVLGAICITLLLILIKGMQVVFRKPYYFIKHLLPWKWISERQYEEYLNICNSIDKNLENYEKWKHGARITRKGRFANLYLPNKEKWYNPKNHLFIIRKEKIL